MKNTFILAAFAIINQASGYTLHEWGTFTSVSGSDGQLLAGLDREEERLPYFVEALDGMRNIGPTGIGSKGFSNQRPLRNVTIKMETPVIYFYCDQPFSAKVKVGFNGGSISQWYPARSGGEIAPPISKKLPVLPIDPKSADFDARFIHQGGIDFASHRNGSIAWNLDVLAPDAPRSLSFKPHETLNWVRPRNSTANILKVGDQYEDYLFYRGVGNFDLPLTLSVDASETLHLKNSSSEKIPFLFVQEVTVDLKVRFHVLKDGLDSTSSVSVSESDFTEGTPKWHRPVYDAMSDGLLATGLTREETDSMIQTWWHSYFEQPGLRVFWIVPTAKTEAILPLEVTPAPAKKVRVLVGRSEVLRPSFEKQLISNYHNRNDKEKRGLWSQNHYHRYGKAYQQRVHQLLKP